MSLMWLNKWEDRCGPVQDMSVEHKITDAHRILPPGNLTKGNDLEEELQEDGDTNQMRTGRVPSGRR